MTTTTKTGFYTILLLLIVQTTSWAETPSKLLEIDGFDKEDMSRVFFSFDGIPEFDVENLGQRVRVFLSQTTIEPSYNKLSQDGVVFKIVANEEKKRSIVDLYLKNTPKFVDFTVDEEHLRLALNIFWHRDGSTARTGILDRRLGTYKAMGTGATARKGIVSEYCGRWHDFFEEYESPVRFSVPINFSFPPIAGYFIERNQGFFQTEFGAEKIEELQGCGEEIIADNTEGDGRIRKSVLLELALAECFIRKKNYEKAMEFLGHVKEDPQDGRTNAWKGYFRSYAEACLGTYYQPSELYSAKAREYFKEEESLAAWVRVFQSEMALAQGKPEAALESLKTETEYDGSLSSIENLRKADSLFQLGQFDLAYSLYEKEAGDQALFRSHPYSLSNWAEVLYKRKEFSKAAAFYSILSEVLEEKNSEGKDLADYRSAMSGVRMGDRSLARAALNEIYGKNGETEAWLLSWLKLKDMDMIDGPKPPLRNVVFEYNKIFELGPSRSIREEAFFKQILSYHLYGKNLMAVKLLGRFFEDFWAGDLLQEAQALFVEIFPKVVAELIEQDNSFLTLALVAKHRELVGQGEITSDFLHSVAAHYRNTGLLENENKTYLFMLDFEKDKEKRKRIFVPLVRNYYEQKKNDLCEKYAAEYLKEYPEGEHRARIVYYYANALVRNGDVQSAANALLDKDRPVTPELDKLAGTLFFDLGHYELVEYYLARAKDAGAEDPEIELKRAESFFHAQQLEKAVPLYESVLKNPRLRGQAACRLIQTFFGLGQKQRALKLFDELAEMEIEEQWLELAAEIVRTENYI